MSKDARIEIIIDPSLLNHFTENLNRQNSSVTPEKAIAGVIATILDDSAFPLEAKRTSELTIHIGYHLRSFSQPFFE